MTIIELKLSTAIKEAGDIEDVRLMKEDAEYILGLLKKADDALNLLKEQEVVEPDMDFEGKWYCSTCGETVGYFPIGCSAPQKFYNFCPECGREVKWE